MCDAHVEGLGNFKVMRSAYDPVTPRARIVLFERVTPEGLRYGVIDWSKDCSRIEGTAFTTTGGVREETLLRTLMLNRDMLATCSAPFGLYEAALKHWQRKVDSYGPGLVTELQVGKGLAPGQLPVDRGPEPAPARSRYEDDNNAFADRLRSALGRGDEPET